MPNQHYTHISHIASSSGSDYEVAITTCAAGIAGCWELRKSSEAVDRATAFDGVSLYLPVLTDIVQYSSHYRQKASELAARCAILKTILCWHCSNHAAADELNNIPLNNIACILYYYHQEYLKSLNDAIN